jgi:hypothetical protein
MDASDATGLRSQARSQAEVKRLPALVRETEELNHFLAHGREIRTRYQAIAVPYVEAVATFVTLFGPGESPQAVAKERLAKLLPPGVEIGALLVSEVNPTDKGAVWLTATLSLSSNDSVAFRNAVLALGDATNGTVWQELSMAADSEKRTLRGTGKVLLLMIQQVE